MPATEEMTITLPKELADIVRAKVASGEYASESDVFASSLRTEFDDDMLEEWLTTVGVARYDAYDANPSDVYSADEVVQAVAEKLNSCNAR